ncbi:YcxB family protein [Dyadobacter sp. CY312]|uniref:YcxB family protein n=1 Tax=Dyadobacter sp. CY312 TaxID=2907303 RepID=UPI001F162AB9|nr:YcxB family protein [Dyadobacter sp. CY312]MCE7043308.1 YcxB family protein [Dyadobacter sp. CY312]
MVQIEYKLTEKELYKGLVENSNSRFITKLFRGFGSVVLVVMVYMTAVNITSGINNFSLAFLFPLVMGVYMVFLPEITAKIQVPNLIKSKNPFTELIKVRMDGNGFRMKGETFSNHLPWEQFHSIVETKDFFLVKAAEATANVLPKRVFTAEDMIEFKSMAASLTGPKVILK